jgi:hypothetical protein
MVDNPRQFQNSIEVTGRVIIGMVVTDDDHLLLCDYNNENSKLVTVYNPSGKYMKTIDVGYRPWDIAIIPRTHIMLLSLDMFPLYLINESSLCHQQ